ncbi:Flp1 family type IVb pilin [Mediterraneibacter faecis]|uniref:Flp1 family type IVb pilin n=1 Tax=Mediterraneibacter faecis TaxID=592978 RepID=UPI003CEA08A6
MRKLLVRKNKDKKYVAAITTIELVLMVILIALLLIFKEQLISLITTIFEKVTSESSGI